MNNLNTYKIFETLNSRGYKSLTEDEFDKILKVNCKNWTKAKTSIYRGQRNLGDYVYMDPRGTHRNSTMKYLTLSKEDLSIKNMNRDLK